MIRFLLLQPFMLLIMIICYITNPIVALFADECGELHGIWKLWQTWDDSCDCAMMVLEKVPKIFRYDFYSKYEEHSRILPEINRKQWYVTLKEGATFSLWERFQRYICRVLWLTRNCAYGFSLYWFGVTLKPNEATEVKNENGITFRFNGNPFLLFLTTPFTYKDDSKIMSIWKYDIYRKFYLGWKFDVQSDETKLTTYMIANRLAWRIEKSR